MSISEMTIVLRDNGGRRLGIDRRQFSYTNYIPDRRLNEARRACLDRRSGQDQRSGIERRNNKVIKMKKHKDLRKERDRRKGLERRVAFAAALAV